MAMQMCKAISSCKWYLKYEGNCAKVPMQPIIATAPSELQHMDFTSIKMIMELDQPPNVASILVFCNHLKNHIMAYVTPNQTTKTVVSFYGKDTHQSLDDWLSSWVTEEPI